MSGILKRENKREETSNQSSQVKRQKRIGCQKTRKSEPVKVISARQYRCANYQVAHWWDPERRQATPHLYYFVTVSLLIRTQGDCNAKQLTVQLPTRAIHLLTQQLSLSTFAANVTQPTTPSSCKMQRDNLRMKCIPLAASHTWLPTHCPKLPFTHTSIILSPLFSIRTRRRNVKYGTTIDGREEDYRKCDKLQQ